MAEGILSPDKQLKNVKLGSYFEMLEEMAKYRRLVLYRGVGYPKINWINALINFYDVMYAESTEHKEKYNVSFERIKELNHIKDITYNELLELTHKMMDFATETGITKMSTLPEEEDAPGGPDEE